MMKYKIKQYILFGLLLCAVMPLHASAEVFEAIIERLKNQYISEKDTAGTSRMLLTQQENGSWSDIDYWDAGRAAWQPREHLRNLQSMAFAYQDARHSLYKNDTLLKGIVNGLTFWYRVNPKSPNWWHNKIGKQHHLAKIALVLHKELSPGLLSQIAGDMAESTEPYTGQNLLWMAEEIIWKGLFNRLYVVGS